jgi:hypothetical protein
VVGQATPIPGYNVRAVWYENYKHCKCHTCVSNVSVTPCRCDNFLVSVQEMNVKVVDMGEGFGITIRER